MSLTPLTDREEIKKAFELTISNLQRGASTFTRKIGWHGVQVMDPRNGAIQLVCNVSEDVSLGLHIRRRRDDYAR